MDPLRYRVDLPLSAEFHPLGFPVRLRTNSREALAAAREDWGRCRPKFERPPLEVRVAVSDEHDAPPPPDPVWRAQRHVLSIVSDQRHFAACDLDRGFSFCWLTPVAMRDACWVRWHFLNTMVYCTLTHLYLTPVHAACVCWQGRGVLLCGESGTGKSTLAYACACQGWKYISDDASYLVRDTGSRISIGSSHQIRFRDTAAALFPELRGRLATRRPGGKLSIEVWTEDLPQVRTATECRADFIVFLDRRPEGDAGLTPVTNEDALARWLGALAVFDRPVREEHEQSLRRLLEADAYELRYSTFDQAVAQLNALVGKGAGR